MGATTHDEYCSADHNAQLTAALWQKNLRIRPCGESQAELHHYSRRVAAFSGPSLMANVRDAVAGPVSTGVQAEPKTLNLKLGWFSIPSTLR